MTKATEMQKEIRPLNDRVLVKADPAAEKIGNIILPDTAKEKPCRGELMALGGDCGDETKELVGKTVFFHNYSGSEAPGHKGLLFIREGDLLGVEE